MFDLKSQGSVPRTAAFTVQNDLNVQYQIDCTKETFKGNEVMFRGRLKAAKTGERDSDGDLDFDWRDGRYASGSVAHSPVSGRFYYQVTAGPKCTWELEVAKT